jgi:excisionase family DNA binding protein
MATAAERELITPTEQEVLQIKELEEFLEGRAPQQVKLVGVSGEILDVPEPIYRALRRILPVMAQGAAISLVPIQQELTTQQAADLLNISRPSLIKLLDAHEIPFQRSRGGHRRIRFTDLMAYKQHRSEARRAALADIMAMSQAYGADEPDDEDALFGIEPDEMNNERN